MSSIVLLPYHPDMLPRLRVLFKACNITVPDSWTFNPWRTVTATDTTTGKIVGFVTSWWDRQPIAWVDMLLVHPEYRNQGIAGKIARMLESVLIEAGARSIRCILDEDEAIVAPLERAGYYKVGKFLIMERHINEA